MCPANHLGTLRSSKPIVWDGDKRSFNSSIKWIASARSKLTAWDDDSVCLGYSPQLHGSCSEPTGWDGDHRSPFEAVPLALLFRAHRVGW